MATIGTALAIILLSVGGLAANTSASPPLPASLDNPRFLAQLAAAISLGALILVVSLLWRGGRTRREVDEMRRDLEKQDKAWQQQNSQIKMIDDSLKVAVNSDSFERLKARVDIIEELREYSVRENQAILELHTQGIRKDFELRISAFEAELENLKQLVKTAVAGAGTAQQAEVTAGELEHLVRRVEGLEALSCAGAFPNPDEPRMLTAVQIDRLSERIGGLIDEARRRLASVPRGDLRRLAGCIHETVLTPGAKEFVLNAVEDWLKEVTSGRVALIRPAVKLGKPTFDRFQHVEVEARPMGGATGRIIEVRRPGFTVGDDIVYRAEVVVTV